MANGRKRTNAIVKQRDNSGKAKGKGNKAKANATSFKPGHPYRFKPGDPRINRNGAPRTHKELEDLIQAIGAEQIDGTAWTRIEAKIRQWFASQKPQDSQNVIEHGWGPVVRKIAPTDPTGEKEYSNLTDDERARRLIALLKSVGLDE